MKRINVAIVGATGLVGQEFIRIMEQRKLPFSSVHLYASDRQVGRKVFVNHKELEVRAPIAQSFDNMDFAIFMAGPEVSQHFAPIAVKAGAIVIDNSAAFRMESWVPLVVPEVNLKDMKKNRGIISNPNCSVIQLVLILNPLQKLGNIKRVIVDTYQSVSNNGATAMEELSNQTKLVLEGRNVVPHLYPHQIAFNLLPETDVFLDNGYSKDEWEIAQETRKILHFEDLAICATCVRVPVYIGDSQSLNIEFADPVSPDDARRVLAESAGIRVLDDLDVSLYPHPWSVVGSDDVLVGRIRQDVSHECGLVLWTVSDNLRKGAALNAFQIAEALIDKD